MSFWTYMLHCADRTFYVGHTDELGKRLAQHETGAVPGYTSTRLPVKLVWSQEFATRQEARETERQLKGWGKPKKLALIRGDWAAVSELARGKSKEGASTSSAKSVEGDTRFLHPHPQALPSEPYSVEVAFRRYADLAHVRFRLTGTVSRIAAPTPAASARRDNLWQHTCFEVFAKLAGGDGYLEFNLSPSTQWAAYRFQRYRDEVSDLAMESPTIRLSRDAYALELTATLALPREMAVSRLGLSAIIEETDGTKSYWALAHPPGAPDFHHPDCFALELPPSRHP